MRDKFKFELTQGVIGASDNINEQLVAKIIDDIADKNINRIIR